MKPTGIERWSEIYSIKVTLSYNKVTPEQSEIK